MTDAPSLVCRDDRRRDLVRVSRFFGLDYLEVGPDQLTLAVTFLGRAPEGIAAANLQIEGGERITNIRVTSLTVQRSGDLSLDDSMLVTVDKPGDFTTYRLCVRSLDAQGRPTAAPMAGFDPRYAGVEFNFKAGCPSDLDCNSPLVCPPPTRTAPDINYLAKDYASFRQLMLDRLAVIMPGWQESHVPDIGVALVEILAYAGDQLSYYQDAVATEAYLATARQRISVRRHARLVDYFMHDGCNARAWLCLHQPGTDFKLTPSDTLFLAGLDRIPALANKTILSLNDLNGVPAAMYDVFEPLVADPSEPIALYAAHNEISFYTWNDRQCCLPAGATRAVLLDTWDGPIQTGVAIPARKLALQPGDVLFFEEVKGPVTGNPADADPSRRWAVRLTSVNPTTDQLIKTADGRPTPLLEIEWAAADALPLPFCLSARLPAPDCRIICDLSVARGNVVLVDHGQTLRPCEDLGTVGMTGRTGNCACEGSIIEMTFTAEVFRPVLKQSPLTFCDSLRNDRPASKMLNQDPRTASPVVVLSGIPPGPDGTAPLFTPADLQDDASLAGALRLRSSPAAQLLYGRLSPGTKNDLSRWDGTGAPPASLLAAIAADLAGLLETWRPLRDLLESGPSDPQFVVEMDDNGLAHLRFGDGVCGRQPDAGTDFLASYRIGNGAAGNVGADRITKIAFRTTSVEGLALSLRNPLAAQGGTDPEPVAEVKLFAPGAFQTVLKRAVTAADYAAIAGRNPDLQQANAALRWTGSWYEAQVAVDPLDSETPDDSLLRRIAGHLHHFRRIGQDLAVDAAQYVPLQIAMTVCVLPHYLRGHVEAALDDAFSNRTLPNGQLGFFAPDNLTFGGGVYLSKVIAAAQAVPGVQSVKVTTFQRLFAPANNELATGVLALGPMEIAQLDNDPSFPEHGTLTLNLRGGR